MKQPGFKKFLASKDEFVTGQRWTLESTVLSSRLNRLRIGARCFALKLLAASSTRALSLYAESADLSLENVQFVEKRRPLEGTLSV